MPSVAAARGSCIAATAALAAALAAALTAALAAATAAAAAAAAVQQLIRPHRVSATQSVRRRRGQGTSNWTALQLAEANQIAERLGMVRQTPAPTAATRWHASTVFSAKGTTFLLCFHYLQLQQRVTVPLWMRTAVAVDERVGWSRLQLQ